MESISSYPETKKILFLGKWFLLMTTFCNLHSSLALVSNKRYLKFSKHHQEKHRSRQMLVSELFLKQVVFTLNLLVISSSIFCFRYLVIGIKSYLNIIFQCNFLWDAEVEKMILFKNDKVLAILAFLFGSWGAKGVTCSRYIPLIQKMDHTTYKRTGYFQV